MIKISQLQWFYKIALLHSIDWMIIKSSHNLCYLCSLIMQDLNLSSNRGSNTMAIYWPDMLFPCRTLENSYSIETSKIGTNTIKSYAARNSVSTLQGPELTLKTVFYHSIWVIPVVKSPYMREWFSKKVLCVLQWPDS